MLIRDTQEYKDLVKLQELHDTYQKHVKPRGHSYGSYLCKGCGLPVNGDKVEDSIAGSICGGYYAENDRRKLQAISPLVFARAMDLEINCEHPKGDLVNYRMLELKDQLPVAEYRAALLKSDVVDAKELYLLATKIDGKPSADIYDRLVTNFMSVIKEGRYQTHEPANAIMAWHHTFGTKPTKEVFKAVITKLGNHDQRPLWSRLAGVRMAVSFRHKSERGAIYAYRMVKDLEMRKFNDVAWMTKMFGGQSITVLMYYRDTGRLIGELDSICTAIKSKLIDKLPVPTEADRAAMDEETLGVVYGDRAKTLALIGGITDSTWRVRYCDSFDEYLQHDSNYQAGDEFKYEYDVDLTRGFAEPDPLEPADDTDD
jgi:hypothetical protein